MSGMRRLLPGQLTRPLGIRLDRWNAPESDPQRTASWAAYRARLPVAIMRARLYQGFDGRTLGDHLYLPVVAARVNQRRAAG